METKKDSYEVLSLGEIESGSKSVFWSTIVMMIQERIELIRTEIELGVIRVSEGDHYVDKTLTMEDIKLRQGECSSLRYVIGLPKIFITEKQKEVQKDG